MVLYGGIDRLLLSASPRRYMLLEVCVTPSRRVILPPFTGKVVKSLFVKANNVLENIFSKPLVLEIDNVKVYVPKPIRVTPLYVRSSNGSTRFLWKKDLGGSKLCLRGGQEACFLVGFEEQLEEEVFKGIMGLDNVELFDAKWSVSQVKVVYNYKLPSSEHDVRLDNATGIRLVFKSPVKLVDPWVKSRYGRFLPLAGVVFSYNIGELLRLWRRNTDYWTIVSLVSAVLRETYRVLETAKVVTYVYDGKKLPGLGGYVTYKVDVELLNNIQGLKYLVENILAHAKIMGVGSSRAIGLGHVEIRLLHSSP